jgi:uncharacterized protein
MVIEIATPVGRAQARILPPAGGTAAQGVLVLGHGAGGGIDSPDLKTVATVATELGLGVALVEQPYRVAGRRSAAPARQLDQAWMACVAALRGGENDAPTGWDRVPLIVGGRSSGARVACRTARAVGAGAVLCLAFPLLPAQHAGDPTKSRQSELDGTGVPVLVVQGERDPFGLPSPDAGRGREVITVPGTHTLRHGEAIQAAVEPWLLVVTAVAKGSLP